MINRQSPGRAAEARPRRGRTRPGLAPAVAVSLCLALFAAACMPNFVDPPAVATGVVASTPAHGGRMIPTSAPVVIRFSAPVSTSSVSVTATPAVALGAAQWQGNTTVVFTPASLPAATSMTLSISGTDAKGQAIAATQVQFDTAPATATLPTAHPRLMLTGTTRQRLATSLSQGTAAAVRFKNAIDDHIFNGSTFIYDYRVWQGAMLGVLTGDARYCADSVQRIDTYVAAAEAEIAANRNPEIAGDSYLYVGDQLGDLALVWDWCSTARTASMTTRWSAFAQQTLYNVWHPSQASWGGRSAPWSGWGTDNPRNNYYLSFLEATLLWGGAANGEHAAAAGWLSQARHQVEHDLTIIHTAETPGGGSLEGTGYGISIKRLLFLEFVWEASTGQRWADLSSSNQAWIRYLVSMVVPTNDYFAPIGDQARISDAPFTDYQREAMLALAELHRGTAWGRRARVSASAKYTAMDRPEEWVFDFIYGVADVGTAAPMPLTYYAPGTGHAFARSGTATSATWLGFLSGPYVESHAHHDALSLLLYKGAWKVHDGGIYSHSGLIQAEEAHALVMLLSGSTPLRMTDGGKAELYAMRSAGDYVHLAGSIASGSLYPGHTITQDREVLFLPPDIVVVMDRVDSGAETLTRRFQLPTPTVATISGDTKVVRTGTASNGLAVHRAYPDVASVATQPFTALVNQIPGMDSDFTDGYRTTTSVTASGKSEFLHVFSLNNAASTVTRVDEAGARGVRIVMADGRTATVFFSVNQRRGTLEIRAADNTVTRQIDLMPGVERPAY
jgi:hypothetical protein